MVRLHRPDVNGFREGTACLRALTAPGAKRLVNDGHMVRAGHERLLWEGAGWDACITVLSPAIEAEVREDDG